MSNINPHDPVSITDPRKPIIILFLDDMVERIPFLPRGYELHYVRNPSEFVAWLKEHGTPDIISFDHDLADESYKDRGYMQGQSETGEDCARWCVENGYVPKRAIVHSWNDYGAAKIAARLADGGCKDVFVKPFNPSKRHDWRE